MTGPLSIETFAKTINQTSSKSFHQQRNLIKKVLIGQTTLCPICQQKLMTHFSENKHLSSIRCVKKCTDIEFEAG